MKQNRMKLPALLLLAGLLCPLISCTAPGEPSVTTDSRTEQVTEPQSEHGTGDTATPDGVSIVANGVADFRIVRTGSTDATLAGAAEKLQRLIRMLTKAEIPVICSRNKEARYIVYERLRATIYRAFYMLFYRQSGLYHTFCDRSCDKSLSDLLPPTKDLPTGFLSGAGLRLLHRKGYRRAFFFFSPSAGMRKIASGGG